MFMKCGSMVRASMHGIATGVYISQRMLFLVLSIGCMGIFTEEQCTKMMRPYYRADLLGLREDGFLLILV